MVLLRLPHEALVTLCKIQSFSVNSVNPAAPACASEVVGHCRRPGRGTVRSRPCTPGALPGLSQAGVEQQFHSCDHHSEPLTGTTPNNDWCQVATHHTKLRLEYESLEACHAIPAQQGLDRQFKAARPPLCGTAARSSGLGASYTASGLSEGVPGQHVPHRL